MNPATLRIMASSQAFLSSILLLILFPMSTLSRPTTTTLSSSSHLSPFGFFKDLEGSRRESKVEGIHKVKSYLQRFGYMTKSSSSSVDDDDHFDDALEEAIKAFQTFYNLNTTGMLDAPTAGLMSQPRCGVPDVPAMTNNHTIISYGHHLNLGSSHYAFFPNNPVWPDGHRHLTYWVDTSAHPQAADAVAAAFAAWAGVTTFTFERLMDPAAVSLKISFEIRDHGDGNPFDGSHGVVAHAFAPVDGRMHYDGEENWVVGKNPDGIDLQMVATHEIGHLLGMAHSQDQSAIMYAITPYNTIKGLAKDDIDGIQALYSGG